MFLMVNFFRKNVTLQILNFILIKVNFVSVFTALNSTKSKENLTLHHMGKYFISLPTGIKFKIWRVTFLKIFYHLIFLGLSSSFRAIDNLPHAY